MPKQKLVIAEKPAVGMALAKVLGCHGKRPGYMIGSGYDGLYHAALCRAKADWLVGINATRLFSVMYRHTLNVGRVMSPTLALIAQREAEIAAFEPVPFYTMGLDCGGVTFAGERVSDPAEANAIAAACRNVPATVRAVERKEKSEKAPALYDLTTLQREANRALGYTAQQTLDYAEKKKLQKQQAANGN